MKKSPGYWNLITCKEDALRFKTKTEWRNNSCSGYCAAKKLRIMHLCSSHMHRPPAWQKKWTLETCKLDALKYKRRSDWMRESAGAYDAAITNKWMEECCSHMKLGSYPKGLWTLDMCKKSAIKYMYRVEWEANDILAYQAAQRRGWLDLCTTHMSILGNTSFKELQLLKIIQEKYPSAHSKFFGKRIKGISGKSFELDIYIPELNKGIEFDGDYWHGRGFRKSWTNSVEEYNKVKKEFFFNKNIIYLNILEKDWDHDQSACLEKIFEFIGAPN